MPYENPLMKTRDFGLDLMASLHLREAYDAIEPWNCKCTACEYLRTEPKIVDALYTILKKESHESRTNRSPTPRV